MLALPVASQIHLALEAFPTELAAEGLEAGVLAGVRDEVGALAEGFSADLTLVWFLSWMAKRGEPR